MKYPIFVLLFISSYLVRAQADELSAIHDFKAYQVDVKPIQAGSTLTTFNNNSESKVKGSVYLFNSWSNNSKVYFKDKVQPLILHGFNYNVQAKRFEYRTSKDSIYSVQSTNIEKVIIGPKTFISHLDPETRLISYYEEVFTAEDLKLLKKYDLGIKEGAVNHMTGKKLNSDIYITKESYYTLDNGTDILTEVKMNKKLISELVDNEDLSQIKKFAKEKHLSFKKDEDVKQILIYAKSI